MAFYFKTHLSESFSAGFAQKKEIFIPLHPAKEKGGGIKHDYRSNQGRREHRESTEEV